MLLALENLYKPMNNIIIGKIVSPFTNDFVIHLFIYIYMYMYIYTLCNKITVKCT